MKEEIQSSAAAILVVEDDARVAGSLQRGLGEAGFVVATADRLAAADEQLARGTPAMPHSAGWIGGNFMVEICHWKSAVPNVES